MNLSRFIAVSALLLTGLTACEQSQPVYHANDNPIRLSDWNLFSVSDNALTPSSESLVFRPANQLFTDYAQKLRTIWIPDGLQATLVDGEIEYPVGTVVSKTFYYPTDSSGDPLLSSEVIAEAVDLNSNKLIETRLLVRRDSGWDAFPYVWNDEESEAFLRVAGTSEQLKLRSDSDEIDFVYFVPNENQCAGCHVTEHPDGDMHPLGAIASQLSVSFDYPLNNDESQLAAMIAREWLPDVMNNFTPVAWRDESASIEDRALSYLNMNCGHCHNPEGAADTSNLILNGEHGQLVNMGLCKPPVAAGGGAGDMLYGIVPGEPERSILLYRMESNAPDEMMPELGRSLVHREGIDLVSQWIGQIQGNCN